MLWSRYPILLSLRKNGGLSLFYLKQRHYGALTFGLRIYKEVRIVKVAPFRRYDKIKVT